MTEQTEVEVRRDAELEERMLAAVIEDRNAQPRSQQVQVGPSSVGGCRELLRAGLFESESLAEPETHWATAAHVGSIMGADLERIFGQRLGALEQQRMTTVFERLGLKISGAVDLMFLDGNQITDLKSTADIGGMLYDLKKNAAAIATLLSVWREGLLYRKKVETADGGYELTESVISKISKLSYYVQVAIYVTGAIQAGILEPGGEGRLVFYDRGGSFQEFVALVITAEEIQMFYDIAQHRVEQVAKAQEAFENGGGNPAIIAHLRDMTPSYCFSAKVMCPRRMHCWAGSDWTTDNRIDNPEHIAAVDRYVAGREMAKLGDGMKRGAREELKDVQGMLPDGRMVTWTRGGSAINVVETTVERPRSLGATLDAAVEAIKPSEEASEELGRAGRQKQLREMKKPSLSLICSSDYDLPSDGLKEELVQRILDHEFPPAPSGDAPPPQAPPMPTASPEGSPWSPGGTTGDPTTDRLRQMQYDADPVMRAKHDGRQA